ncbi:MAG: glycosyltransferase [Actinomycetota bacterium]
MVSTQAPPGDPSPRATGRRAPAVLVILVVKDGERWLRDCLRALAQQTYPRLGVVAVDNGSTDGSREILRRALGEARVLGRPDNPGLPAAVQSALATDAAQGADYVLIHHDDVALDPEAITHMVEVAERIDAVGVVGPKVVDWDDPTILREVGLSTDRFGYPYSPLEQDELDQGQYDRVREVMFVSSSAMLVSRAALDRTGLPDERFSSFHEDLDFCWRARLAGFRVVMTPLARARHRGATRRGERPLARRADRARFEAERASLGVMLKNYGLVSLLWVIPLYLAQGAGKLALWALERRFEEVWQVLAAWGWNLLHLPGTIRRRVRAQSVRAIPDRSVRRYMAPATLRLRRWAEIASRTLVGRGGGLAPEELEGLEDLEEPPAITRRALSLARAHPVATACVLTAVLAAFAYRGLYGGGALQGGALALPPPHPTDYFRELLSSTRNTGLGGTQPASPALGFLGVMSMVLGASTAVAQKVLLVGLPLGAAYGFYRTFLRETGDRVPAVVGAACYGLSAVLLWGLSEGRIPVLVMLAALPLLAGRINMAFGVPGLRSRRFVAATSMVLAAAVAFYPGSILAIALVALTWLAFPTPGERKTRALALLGGSVAGAALLLLPQAIDLVAGGGHGLSSFVGRPSFLSLVRLAPGGGPGSWAVSWFLPIAALLAFTLVDRAFRSATRYLIIALVAVSLAWASAAGLLPEAISNTAAYLGAAALAYCALVAYGLASALPRMGTSAFGYRQFAVVGVVGLLLGGIGLQAALAAKGGWAIGTDRVPPAWTLVDAPGHGGQFRVLWLGRLTGEPFAPPGGDPTATLDLGRESVRYALTDRFGTLDVDVGRDERGPGYRYLEAALADIVSGTTDHGGALLAPLGVRFIVASAGDLPRGVRRSLGQQVDLDIVPTIGLTIFKDFRSLREAAFTSKEQYVEPAIKNLTDAGRLPATETTPLLARRGGSFAGRVPDAGAVFLADQFAGGWRLRAEGSTSSPDRVFGWSMRFPAEKTGSVQLVPPPQTVRRLEIALMALLWFGALWVTRRPARA